MPVNVLPVPKRAALAVALLLSAAVLEACDRTLLGPDPPGNAIGYFDGLWRDFDRYYALFDVKRVDWDAAYARYRAQVYEQTTPAELWTVMTGMLGELDDPHVTLATPDLSVIYTSGSVQGRTMDPFSLDVIAARYLGETVQTTGNGRILYGTISGAAIGYISIGSFAGDDDAWAEAVDGVVADLSNVRAMIVDIRGNVGGSTGSYQYIAAAFADRRIEYLSCRSRNGPRHTDFNAPGLLSIAPRNGAWPAEKKIALLTNRLSASSSDHFAWIFKHHLSYATVIGDTTAGVFGSVPYWRALPNGWTYKFTAMLCTTPNGVAPDSLGGVVPDVVVTNSAADIAAGRDAVMDFAIRFLAP